MRNPMMLVWAGPNGSGKSTITSAYPIIGDYVNADEIQTELRCPPLEAAQIAEKTRRRLLSDNKDFTFETLLSTDMNYLLMEDGKRQGYNVVCIYVLTADPKINVARVIARNRFDGNDVPPEKVVKRYCRALKLFPRLFPVCDELYVYDNSHDRSEGTPERILQMRFGKVELFPSDVWTKEMLEDLMQGRYAEQYESD